MRVQLSWILLVVLVPACGSGDGAQVCGDTICPEPMICDANEMCVTPPECSAETEGELCSGGNGICEGGNCAEFQCDGDAIDPNEICDGTAGTSDCSDLGYEFGVQTCVGCTALSDGRCGLLGWREIGPGAASAPVSGGGVFAVGEDIWVSSQNTGHHWDGSQWTEIPALAGGAIHGTSADDLWVFDGSAARHVVGGAIADEYTLGDAPSGAIVAISETEVYAAGRRAAGLATIWKFDGVDFDEVVFEIADPRYRAIAAAGGTVVAVRPGAVTAVSGGTATDFPLAEINGSIAARGAGDFVVQGSPGTFHFDGQTTPTALYPQSGVLGASGDRTFILSASPGIGLPGEMYVHEATSADGVIRAVGLGTRPVAGFTSSVGALHSGPGRIIALVNNSGSPLGSSTQLFEFKGAARAYLADSAAASPGVRDLEISGSAAAYLRSDGGNGFLGTISDAFGSDPIVTEVAIASPGQAIWIAAPNLYFAASGGDLLEYDDAGNSQIAVAGAGPIEDIAGSSGALAVGLGVALDYDGADWQDADPDGVLGGAHLRAVAALSDGYVAVGVPSIGSAQGAIFINRAGVWIEVMAAAGPLLAVAGESTVDFYVAGSGGSLLHCTDNSGTIACERIAVDAASRFTSIAYVSATDVLVIGGDNGLHFDGVRWSPVTFRTGQAIVQAHGRGDRIWLASETGNRGLERVERMQSWSANSVEGVAQ